MNLLLDRSSEEEKSTRGSAFAKPDPHDINFEALYQQMEDLLTSFKEGTPELRRVKKWMKKLKKGRFLYIAQKRNRNLYAKLLLLCMMRGKLDSPPFHTIPPKLDDTLPTLPAYQAAQLQMLHSRQIMSQNFFSSSGSALATRKRKSIRSNSTPKLRSGKYIGAKDSSALNNLSGSLSSSLMRSYTPKSVSTMGASRGIQAEKESIFEYSNGTPIGKRMHPILSFQTKDGQEFSSYDNFTWAQSSPSQESSHIQITSQTQGSSHKKIGEEEHIINEERFKPKAWQKQRIDKDVYTTESVSPPTFEQSASPSVNNHTESQAGNLKIIDRQLESTTSSQHSDTIHSSPSISLPVTREEILDSPSDSSEGAMKKFSKLENIAIRSRNPYSPSQGKQDTYKPLPSPITMRSPQSTQREGAQVNRSRGSNEIHSPNHLSTELSPYAIQLINIERERNRVLQDQVQQLRQQLLEAKNNIDLYKHHAHRMEEECLAVLQLSYKEDEAYLQKIDSMFNEHGKKLRYQRFIQ